MLGLAAPLARQRDASLVLELDPQGSATKLLGVKVESRPTVADALLELGMSGVRRVDSPNRSTPRRRPQSISSSAEAAPAAVCCTAVRRRS
jgi:cellulose biosynthesis protein BcsQ